PREVTRDEVAVVGESSKIPEPAFTGATGNDRRSSRRTLRTSPDGLRVDADLAAAAADGAALLLTTRHVVRASAPVRPDPQRAHHRAVHHAERDVVRMRPTAPEHRAGGEQNRSD